VIRSIYPLPLVLLETVFKRTILIIAAKKPFVKGKSAQQNGRPPDSMAAVRFLLFFVLRR